MVLGTELNDDALTEILLRLPPKSVLRSRAVCKHWRRVTTGDSFLAAYSRRRPLELILYPNRHMCSRRETHMVPIEGGDGDGAGCPRLLSNATPLKLFGSCDGLLLFMDGDDFVICNPATRHWARFPALSPVPCMWAKPSGFYLHRPSGEHRVLCIAEDIPPTMYYDWSERVYGYKRFNPGVDPWATGDAAVELPQTDEQDEGAVRWRPVHYVFSTGAAQPRRLGPFAEYRGKNPWPPNGVDIGGTLHWARHSWTGKDSTSMLAFDTVSEKFRRMPLPPAAATVPDHLMNLFDLRGTLAASAMGEWPYLDVWTLDDYDSERWSRRVRVELPAAATGPYARRFGAAVAVLEGDVLVLFAIGGWVTLYDVKEKRTVRLVCCGDNRGDTCWCVHRESLAPAVIHGLSGVVPAHHQLEGCAAIHCSSEMNS